MTFSWAVISSDNACLLTGSADACKVLPSSVVPSTSVGETSLPPLTTAAVIRAICTGEAVSSP